MYSNSLHIISFDIPYPPDYGGVIDVFYKLNALAESGIKIHLHCFEYGRKHPEELNKYCATVSYYKRKKSIFHFFSRLPFIVVSRKSEQLIQNLLRDSAPILMEGLHTTLYIKDRRLQKRKIIVRAHNIEHEYYHHLVRSEKNIFKKIYFYSEAKKLLTYENVLKEVYGVATISPADTSTIKNRFKNCFYLPAFHPNNIVTSKTGIGKYALYHGNLKVAENNEAALFLVNEVFSKISYPLIIAGNNPSAGLIKAISNYKNMKMLANVTNESMQQLIADAQLNILPAFQPTGIKLKLINALYNGRFCIVNPMMIEHTGLEQLCISKETPSEIITAIQEYSIREFSSEMIDQRKSILHAEFNNAANAKKLLAALFEK